MVETGPQLRPLTERLSGRAADYVRALFEFSRNNEDEFLLETIGDAAFLSAQLSPERAITGLKHKVRQLRDLAMPLQNSSDARIRTNWETANKFLKEYRQQLHYCNCEAVFFGSMIFGHPDKADLDLRIIAKVNSIPRSLEKKMYTDISYRTGDSGYDFGFSFLNTWTEHLRDDIFYTEPDKASILFTETLHMAPVLYGTPYGLLESDRMDNIRWHILTAARSYPVAGAQLSYTVDLELDRVLTRRGSSR
jgi:hypothetical protein